MRRRSCNALRSVLELAGRQRLESLVGDGYVVIPDLLDGQHLERIRTEMMPWLADAPFGRNDFEGFRTQRLYALLAKAPSLASLVAHPAVLSLLDELLQPGYLLSANIGINVHPGETAQLFHADDAYCSFPRPRPAVGVSAVWAFDDFTADNGATEVVTGSHEWATTTVEPDEPRIHRVEMAAGSAVIFLGTTLHRGGAHNGRDPRLGITPQYCQPWMRQIENMTLAIPHDVAASLPVRVQELIGYSIYPPFIGYVDGMHPRRIFEATPR